MTDIVHFSSTNVPYGAFVVARLCKRDCVFKPSTDSTITTAQLQTPEGGVFRGNALVAELLAVRSGREELLGGSPSEVLSVREWVETGLSELTGDAFPMTVQRLNAHLTFRTYIVGHKITLADISMWEALRSCGPFRGILARFEDRIPHVARWFVSLDNDPLFSTNARVLLAALRSKASTSNTKGGSSQLEAAADGEGEKKKKGGKGGKGGKKDGGKKKGGAGAEEGGDDEFRLFLEGAVSGEVVTRFPPEPSGYLHIGHLKAALINDYFAKKYHGKLLLRFDDTNPAKEKEEFETSIMEDLKKVCVVFHSMSHTSDHFPYIFEVAERLLHEGKMYVDTTPVEQMRKEKFDGIESACRNNTVEKNLELWEEMKKGSEIGKQCVVRAKFDMAAKNKTLRDPSMLRCIDMVHPRTGINHHVYPLYDFACPIVDSVEGVTHALRSNEYQDRNIQYAQVLEMCGLRKVHIWGFSRMNFVRTLLSKRKLAHFVNTGIAMGWDDPRFPTIRGLLRRGIDVRALRHFVLMQGASKNMNLMTWDKIWAVNKQFMDPEVPRYTAIYSKNIVPFELVNGPEEVVWEDRPLHRKNEALGTKKMALFKRVLLSQEDACAISAGEEITLMSWGNVIIDSIDKDAETGIVRSIVGRLHLEGDFRKTKTKLTWLANVDGLLSATCVELDHLITKDKIEEGDNLEDFVTPQSRIDHEVICETCVRDMKKGVRFQFERIGYFVCDSAYTKEPEAFPIFFQIPDGHVRK